GRQVESHGAERGVRVQSDSSRPKLAPTYSALKSPVHESREIPNPAIDRADPTSLRQGTAEGPPPLDDRASAGHQTHDEQDDGQYQQDVDKRTDRVGSNASKEPRNQQNNRQGVKHFDPPPLHTFWCKKRCLNRASS